MESSWRAAEIIDALKLGTKQLRSTDILSLSDVLPNFILTKNEMMRDFHL